jgi:hypothetical protein
VAARAVLQQPEVVAKVSLLDPMTTPPVSPQSDGETLKSFKKILAKLSSRRSAIEKARRWVAAHPHLLSAIGVLLLSNLRSTECSPSKRLVILYMVHEMIKTTPPALTAWRGDMGSMLQAAKKGHDADGLKRWKKVRACVL